MPISAAIFLANGCLMLRKAPGLSQVVEERRFRALFGATPEVCENLWSWIGGDLPKRASPKHLLWALMFLKIYASEHVHRLIAGADEKTFRKWSWDFVHHIANLPVVIYSLSAAHCPYLMANSSISYFISRLCGRRGSLVIPWMVALSPLMEPTFE